MNQPTITLPHRFQGGGYDVTVNADRSIKVRQGDWLSKYSMAIYGDFDHIDKFWRKKKNEKNEIWEEIKNKDLIQAGETLYHRDPLPGEKEGVGDSKPPLLAERIAEFGSWIKHRFLMTRWETEGPGGVDLSLSAITVQYLTIGMKDKATLDPQAKTRWYHMFAGGLGFGWPEEISVGGSFSTVQFPSAGIILRAPWYPTLSYKDFRGGTLVIEFGINVVMFVGGGSAAMLMFGMGFEPTKVLRELDRFFRHGDRGVLERVLFDATPSGVAFLAGSSVGIPGWGFAGRVGFMRDLPAPWRQR